MMAAPTDPHPIWAVVPAGGRGRRFGGEVPKQYLSVAGKPVIAHALDALLAHPRVAGAVVAVAADDDVIMDRNAERLCRVDDLAGHVDVGA